MKLKAEVIAIGDELTSGHRLDTNTQWLSQQLGVLGIEVAFHTTVGDVLEDNVTVFDAAFRRADIVVSTGGLGPTADDLTRHAIAAATQTELILHEDIISHIESIFARHSRTMPENNRIQAYFPAGSVVINNPEGTAPGIDFTIADEAMKSRVFALPGVPAEMKQMWHETVGDCVRKMTGETRTSHHHVLHCFGIGESQCELMLPDMINRSRDPRVGITASSATISLRISTFEQSTEACLEKMQPTIAEIKNILGDIVFAENGLQLQDVVAGQLVDQNKTISIVDLGLQGTPGQWLMQNDMKDLSQLFKTNVVLTTAISQPWFGNALDMNSTMSEWARKIRSDSQSDIGVAIGPIQYDDSANGRGHYDVAISDSNGIVEHTNRVGGHSAFRHARSTKQVLNQIRLSLLQRAPVLPELTQ